MKQETIFLTYDQALDLVDRIAERAKRFNHVMIDNEKEAMAQLLSDVGVMVGDLVDVSRLADEWAINADIRESSECTREEKMDALFSWKNEEGETCYCLNW